MTVYEMLLSAKDDAYREFQAKLVPNIPKETILGVKTPQMREIAKKVAGGAERDAFLKSLPHKYYEENLIHFFVISLMKDFDECVKAVEEFLPYVDCWPVSDQASLFRLLGDAPCGVTLNAQCLMSPVKSVSGVIGLGTGLRRLAYACQLCTMTGCRFRGH